MASNNKGGVQSLHQLVTLKIKQLAIIIEILVICLSPLNEFPTKSLSVNFTKEVVEVLDQNLSPPKINKTRAYESKKKFQVSWATKLPWVDLWVESNGFVHIIKCKNYSKIEH